MNWLQHYNPLGSLGLSAIVAAIPPVHPAVHAGHPAFQGALCGVLRHPGRGIAGHHRVGHAGGPRRVRHALRRGLGLFPIGWIVVTAVCVYRVTVECGQFEVIKRSIASLTDDRRLQALLIAFSFGAFLEGAAGFGTPVAISGGDARRPRLPAVVRGRHLPDRQHRPGRVRRHRHPIVVAGQVTGIDDFLIAQMVGRQLPFLSVLVPLWLSVTMCGWKRSMEVLPAIIVAGLCFAISQFVVSNFVGPYLPDIISAIVTILGLGIFLRLWKPKQVFHFADEKPAGPVTCQFSAGEVVRASGPLCHPGHHGLSVGPGIRQVCPGAHWHQV